jgi:hypothetical protein
MSLPIRVDVYSGYKSNERPQQFILKFQTLNAPARAASVLRTS